MPFNLPDPLIDDPSVQRNFDALVARFGAVENLPARVTSLPATPLDGQTIDFAADATNGVVWRLRYNAASASAYKWEFVGGSSLWAVVETLETTTSTSFTDLTTVGPSIVLPLAGDYQARYGANSRVDTVGNGTYVAPTATGLAAGVTQAAYIEASAINQFAQAFRTRRLTGVSGTLKLQYAVTSANTAGFQRRDLEAIPVRVG